MEKEVAVANYSYGAPLRKQESGACHSFLSLGGRHGSFLSLICTFSADGKGSYKVTKLHNFRFVGYKVIVILGRVELRGGWC